MHIDYDISEQDFVHAQRLARRVTSTPLARLAELALPVLGFVLLVLAIYRFAAHGASVVSVLGWGFSLYLILIPLEIETQYHQLYRKREDLHGSLSLDVQGEGVRFQAETGVLEFSWVRVGRCIEDSQVFVLPKKGQAFQVVPKRCLTAPQIHEFRRCFKQLSLPNRGAVGHMIHHSPIHFAKS